MPFTTLKLVLCLIPFVLSVSSNTTSGGESWSSYIKHEDDEIEKMYEGVRLKNKNNLAREQPLVSISLLFRFFKVYLNTFHNLTKNKFLLTV